MEGFAPPSFSLPGVRNYRRRFISANEFAGGEPGGWKPDAVFTTANNLMIKALVSLDDVWPSADLLPRVVWSTSSTTTTQTATWRVRLAKVPISGTVAPNSATLTALDTTLTASAALATADVPIQTAQGRKIGGILADPTDLLLIAVDLNAISGLSANQFTGDNITFLGIILEYMRGQL